VRRDASSDHRPVDIGAHRIETAGEVLGPIAAANLRNADWATLVIDRQLVL